MSSIQVDTQLEQPIFTLKGSLFTLTILQLRELNPEQFVIHLQKTIAQAPSFFLNAPIVIDLQYVNQKNCRIDFCEMSQCLIDHQLIPIGVCNANEQQQQEAIKARLAILPNPKYQSNIKPTKTNENLTHYPTKMITHPIRSGQQIYAKNTDLIIVSTVSHGAEILADGNIHVYGTLRGRALAGINGNKEARIFCQKLEAELISIAGYYQLSDEFAAYQSQNNIQIYLENDSLHISH